MTTPHDQMGPALACGLTLALAVLVGLLLVGGYYDLRAII